MASQSIFKFFEQLPRQGPGSDAYTAKAFDLVRSFLPDDAIILDIGCGTGTQTLVLAQLMPKAHITALDVYQPFLDRLKRLQLNLKMKSMPIHTVQGSMSDLKFETESFNLIWSEGAIYIIGFEKGLNYWKQFLKPDGIMVVSEVIWLSENPPDEIRQFWESEYPAISNFKKNTEIIAENDMELISHFTLPRDAWWDNYYEPVLKKIASYNSKANQEMDQFISEMKNEIQIYKRFGQYYSYVFFLMRKK